MQVGTPSEIYEFPQSRFIADFIGTTNLFEGTVAAIESGRIRVTSPEAGGDLLVDDLGRVTAGQRVWVALRPEKIRLSKDAARRAIESINCRVSSGNWATWAIDRPIGSRWPPVKC